MHDIAVVVVSHLIILKKEITMKKLLQHIMVHLFVAIGLTHAGHLLLQSGGEVAFSGE